MPNKLNLTELEASAVSHLFKVLGDKTRIKIINALYHHELYVQEIASRLNMSHSAISHQLKVLRDARLVKYTKVGTAVRYALVDDHVVMIFQQALAHVNE